ncbi:MAG: phosphodiester glycosidase family protein, partial [Chloroflexi bacterium]|nr:phosphodiester glycosidase family protein [Chloroflexota bacterium]
TPFTSPDNQHSRRTAIAQTSTGQIVLVIAPHYSLTLVELAARLIDPKLDLAIAVNLDGGSSTGYWAGRGDNLDSDKPIPAVIAAYPR